MKKLNTDLATEHLAKVKKNNAKVRAQANPLVRGMMDQVQEAIDSENELMNQRLDGENRLRAQAEKLCGVKLDMTEIEELNSRIQAVKAGGVFTFVPRRPKAGEERPAPVNVYKTTFGTVDRLENYIFALEHTIVDLTNQAKPREEPKPQEQFTDLSFFGLIKLAFKRLLTRSK